MKKRKARKPQPDATPQTPPRQQPAHEPERRIPFRRAETRESPSAEKEFGAPSPFTVPMRASFAEDAEPTVTRGLPMPVLLIGLTAILVYVGGLYVSSTAGGFDPRVFQPYQSVKQLEDLQPKSSADEQYVQGRKVYSFICVQCHMENGQGNPTGFIPPLAGSEWVLAEQPGRIIRIVSKGLQGPMKVLGQDFGGAAMFAVGDQLPGDDEEKSRQVAAVLTYIRNTWGNKAPPVTIEQVKAVRARIKDRTEAWTAEELLKIPESE